MENYNEETIFYTLYHYLTYRFNCYIHHNVNSKKQAEIISDYYTSFVSSVQTLDLALAQTNETNDHEDIAQKMFDAYTYIIFTNDRLALLKEKTINFPEIDVLINDFILFRESYASLVRHQIGDSNPVAMKANSKVVEQIHLFVNDLPKEYEDTEEFSKQINAAAEHIKPLLHISFE